MLKTFSLWDSRLQAKVPTTQVFSTPSYQPVARKKRFVTFCPLSGRSSVVPGRGQAAPGAELPRDREAGPWRLDGGGDQTSLDSNARTEDAQALLLKLTCLLLTPRLFT